MIEKDKVLEVIHSLGGCDASDEYTKGWDDAISAVYDEVAKLIDVVNKKKKR